MVCRVSQTVAESGKSRKTLRKHGRRGIYPRLGCLLGGNLGFVGAGGLPLGRHARKVADRDDDKQTENQ